MHACMSGSLALSCTMSRHLAMGVHKGFRGCGLPLNPHSAPGPGPPPVQASRHGDHTWPATAHAHPAASHVYKGLHSLASSRIGSGSPLTRGRAGHVVTRASPADARGSQSFDVWELEVKEGYSAEDNAAYWETRPVPVISRLLRIGVEASRWWLLSSGLGKVLSPSGAGPASSPALLLDSLIRLGPAFVKIGQALSSRPDVLPPDFLQELEKLQDRIPAFPNAAAFAVMEQELRQPVSTLFTRISPDPVAAASLGQVYRAQLADGRDVAVKVQRPGVTEMIAMDVFILRYLAAVLRKWFKFNTDLPALVDEWATSLFRELDYNREAANATKFKQLFMRMPEVYVPEMYTEYTTSKVMTMEWVEGRRLRTASSSGGLAPLDAQSKGSPEDLLLVEVGVRCSLEQMLEEGFYHADPHPGNLLKMPDGRLAYLDFGMMGSIDLPVRQALVRATLHLVNREYSALADDIVALGFLPPGSDRSQVVPALTSVFQQALANGVSNLSFGDLSTSLGRTMYKFKFRVPAYYTLLVRSLTVLEGIALASDRNYKVLSAAYPWVARRLLTDRSPELHATLRRLLYADNDRFQFARLSSLLEQAAKVKALGQMRALSAGSGNGAPGTSPLKLLLSKEGAFVRGILLDEVAKGIDAAWRLTFDAAVDSARRRTAAFPLFPLSFAARGQTTQALAAVLPILQLSAPTPPQSALLGFWGASTGSQQGSSAPSSPLAMLLQAVPKLASTEDAEQVEGLTTLASAMFSISAAKSAASPQQATAGGGPQLLAPLLSPAATAQVQQAALFLQWLVSEIANLPKEEREEAVMIPLQLLDRVSSRLVARAIRNTISPAVPAALQEAA